MRIARILTRLNLGGPARQVLAADPLLIARGHELCVFAGSSEPGEGDLVDEARARGLDVVPVPGLRRGIALAGNVRALRFLRRALARYEPDVLHTHASKAGTLGRLAARGHKGLARVHTFHGHVLEGYFPAAVARRIVAHERRLARATDRIVAVSQATAQDLLRLGVAPSEKLCVVPPGVALEALLALPLRRARRRIVAADARALVVGVIGRLAPVKRPELALEVFRALAPRHPELALVFVGDGSERARLERAIAALPEGLRRRAHLLGACADMAAVLGELDVVLSTSRSEGLPVALIEAAAAGLPVVATPVGGVPEVVLHGRTGLLGHDTGELALHLERLLGDPALRAELGAHARTHVRERHGSAALADALEELYRAVLEERACVS